MIRRLVMFCALAGSAGYAGSPTFHEYRTPNYTLIMDGKLPASLLMQQLVELDRVLDQLVPSNSAHANYPTTIFVAPETRWAAYLPLGPYSPAFLPLRFSNWLVFCGWKPTSRLRGRDYMEYTRLYLREKYPGRYPYWYEQGLANFMSSAGIAHDNALIGYNPFTGYPLGKSPFSLEGAMAHRIRVSTEVALGIDPWSPEYADLKDSAPIDFQFWTLVERSLFEREFSARTTAYLVQIDKLQSIGNAIQTGFGATPAQLDAEMELYEKRSEYKTIRVPFERVLVAEPDAARTMSEGEAMALLGSAMADIDYQLDSWQKLADAAKKAGAPATSLEDLALHLGARSPEPKGLEVALDEIAPRLGNPEVAREAGLAIVEKLHVYGPTTELSGELTPLRVKAFELLGQALRANPRDIEAASAHALLASQLNRELDSAAAVLAATRKLMPRSPDAAYAAAILEESRGNQEMALSEARTVARFSRLQGQRQWAEQRVARYQSAVK
jgi:hypothetical protein